MNDEACMAMEQGVFDTQVKIGACADAIDTLLPEYLALSKSTYPNLNIEIKVGRSRWLASALRRGEIDLMLDVEEHTEFNCDILRTSLLCGFPERARTMKTTLCCHLSLSIRLAFFDGSRWMHLTQRAAPGVPRSRRQQ
ncbi:LysR substrate-binding domain-containing protein [Advenella kashmirensis]|uniref:LysR substrate-binding domain-containing protein n=1 Tax=Advenella kashmirensis TaxID=310575 RepID=UPI001EE67CEB|nr:LysR substrate-binding domain-containing protein [Advenella kashmirensis]